MVVCLFGIDAVRRREWPDIRPRVSRARATWAKRTSLFERRRLADHRSRRIRHRPRADALVYLWCLPLPLVQVTPRRPEGDFSAPAHTAPPSTGDLPIPPAPKPAPVQGLRSRARLNSPTRIVTSGPENSRSYSGESAQDFRTIHESSETTTPRNIRRSMPFAAAAG